MYRKFPRDGSNNYNNTGGTGMRRRYRGQYYRSRVSPDRQLDEQQHMRGGPSPPLPMLPHNQQLHHHQQQQQQHSSSSSHQYPQQQQRHHNQRRNSNQHDIDELRELCSKLSLELETVKARVVELNANLEQLKQQQSQVMQPSSAGQPLPSNTVATAADKRKGTKYSKKREAKAGTLSAQSTSDNIKPLEIGKERNAEGKRRPPKRQARDKIAAKPLPLRANDDSTTQAADPSSEDKVEGEEGGDRVRVVRRKKQHFNKRFYGNRRRRVDSSERNSNDTSPQNEANGDEYRAKPSRARNAPRKSYPELSESELSEVVQAIKRDFLAADIPAVKKIIDEKGPVVAREFASSILDHAMCDVTSPTKLSDIANSLFHILISDDSGSEFQQGFSAALSDISKRGADIAIDAPRYMDTLGQVLGQCIAPMNTNRHKQLLKRFLNRSLQSYSQESRASLLASIMRGIASHKSDRFAKEIWDAANLKWEGILNEGTDLAEFLESEAVTFTTKTFSPEPRKAKRAPEELEKFADDVTALVEKKCSPQTLDDLVKDLELDADDRIDYLGTLVYATVRGCIATDSGDYKLNTEALNRYSSVLTGKHLVVNNSGEKRSKKEQHDAISLRALTDLTKLWHSHNCPQDLLSTILLALHGNGAASYDSLKTWLNSDDLKNIPGIGAARLNTKRCIEDLGASRG